MGRTKKTERRQPIAISLAPGTLQKLDRLSKKLKLPRGHVIEGLLQSASPKLEVTVDEVVTKLARKIEIQFHEILTSTLYGDLKSEVAILETQRKRLIKKSEIYNAHAEKSSDALEKLKAGQPSGFIELSAKGKRRRIRKK